MTAEFEARRAEVHLSLLNAIESPVTRCIEQLSCKNNLQVAGQYFHNLASCELFPLAKALREESISTILQRMPSFQEPTVTRCPEREQCSSCQWNQTLNFKNKMRSERKIISKIKVGVCLDCVKTGRESQRSDVCRVKHHCAVDAPEVVMW